MPDNLIGPRGGLGPQGFRGPAGPPGPTGAPAETINTLSNYNWTGVNTFVTSSVTDNSNRVATTAFVANSIANEVTRAIDAETVLTGALDLKANASNVTSSLAAKAPLVNPTFETDIVVNTDLKIGKGNLTVTTPVTPNLNIVFGVNSLSQNTTGNGNIAIGNQTLYNNVGGGSNIAIGNFVGYSSINGFSNTFLGSGADTDNINTYENSVALGCNSIITASNQIVLGNRDITQVNIPDPNAELIVGGVNIKDSLNLKLDITYVNQKINELIGNAPEALNTLKEIATALNNDDSLASTLTNSIALKANASDFTSSLNLKANSSYVVDELSKKSDLIVKVITSGDDLDANKCYNIQNLPNGNCTIINELISTKSTVNGTVNSMCQIGNIIYLGGSFTTFNNNDGQGNITTNRICKYDTTETTPKFSTMGGSGTSTGVSSTVNALCAVGTTLYIGGDFITFNNGTGPTTTNNICKYNTEPTSLLFSTMNNLPNLSTNTNTGVSGTVNALCAVGTILYIGGNFSTFNNGSGNTTTNYICKYNTQTPPLLFSTMNNLSDLSTNSNTGVTLTVYALCAVDTTLYIGGDFLLFNNGTGLTTTNNICKYNIATFTFSTMGGTGENTGVSSVNTVRALCAVGKTLYIGGTFSTFNNGSGNTTTNRICKYNTEPTSLLFSTMNNNSNPSTETNTGVNSTVNALCAVGTTLYIGGAFSTFNNGSGPTTTNYICKYDTTTSTFSTHLSMNSTVLALYEFNGIIYYGGNFLTVNNKPYSYFLNGKTFTELTYNNNLLFFIENGSFENINVTSYNNKKYIYVPSLYTKYII